MMEMLRTLMPSRGLILSRPRAAALGAGMLAGILMFIGAGALVYAQQTNPLYTLPGSARAYASGSLALADDGRTVIAANMLNDTVSIALPLQNQMQAEIPVGDDPRSVALTPDNTRALVVNRGSGTLSVVDIAARAVSATYNVGILPYAVVSNANDSAYVSLQATHEVIRLDLTSGQITARIPTPPSPAGLLLWGDFLYVTHLWTGQLSLIYLPQMSVVRTVRATPDTALSQGMTLETGRGLLYLPQSRSNAQNTSPTYDTLIFPVVNVVDLRDMGPQRAARITLDTADRPVNMPFAAALDPARRWLFVVNAGSDDVSVIDLATGQARANIPVGANPRGVVLTRDNSYAFVHNMIDGTIATIDTRALTVIDVLPISNLTIPVDILIGAQLFHSAGDRRMSAANWASCASCHFDGQPDGRVWLGMDGGPRSTPPLFDLDNTAPYTWTGEWDELADVELKMRGMLGGEGLLTGPVNPSLGSPHTDLSLDLDILTGYLATLRGPATPPGDDPAQVAAGAALFERLECAGCHAGTAFVDGLQHDVGTGGVYDTPSLRWLWLSAPYFHDGRAATVREVFILPGAHQLTGTLTPDELDALAAYLLSLPDGQ